jgi:hypothetical protein
MLERVLNAVVSTYYALPRRAKHIRQGPVINTIGNMYVFLGEHERTRAFRATGRGGWAQAIDVPITGETFFLPTSVTATREKVA